jgi:predicted esterase
LAPALLLVVLAAATGCGDDAKGATSEGATSEGSGGAGGTSEGVTSAGLATGSAGNGTGSSVGAAGAASPNAASTGQGPASGGGGDGGGGDGGGGGGNMTTAGSSGQGTGGGALQDLPPDSGGAHVQHPRGTTDAAYGYWLYTLGGYQEAAQSYPLLVFLHGKGERGNGVSDLGRVVNQGVPKLIQQGVWGPTYPMLVASPQYDAPDGVGNDNNWGEGDPSRLRGFIQHLTSTYRVDASRIYLTGLSHGGNGVYDYLILQDEATSLIAAAAPIAAWGPNNHRDNAPHTPIWSSSGATTATTSTRRATSSRATTRRSQRRNMPRG